MKIEFVVTWAPCKLSLSIVLAAIFILPPMAEADAPDVTVTSPADGTAIDEGTPLSFTATALDTEDGDVSASLTWNSSLDGLLGTGPSISTTLSVGAHTVTASAEDSFGQTGNDSIAIEINAFPNTTKTFFQNYLKPAYFLPVFPLAGEQLGGDLSASYDQAYMPVRSWAELLIIGEFPRARYFSITLYDDHGAIIDTLRDEQIEPLRFNESNPYRPGGPFGTEDILYAIRVQLGNNLAETPKAGCKLDNFNIASNILDGRLRHTAGTRYSSAQSNFSVTKDNVTVVHDDALNNSGVSIVVRRYLEENDGNAGAIDLTTPIIFIRQVSDGCGMNMWDLINKPQPNSTSYISPSDWYMARTTFNPTQVAGHIEHSKTMPIQQPFGLDPNNTVTWYGGPEYIQTTNPDTGYLSAGIPAAAKPAALNAAGKVMRLRFRLPQVPCMGFACAITGAEQMRYWGISFVEGQSTVIKTISDLDLNPNPGGYVDLIISFGTPLPSWVTPANGYSVVYMDPSDIRLMTLRNIIPGQGFGCSVDNVPFKTNEHNANGGYMGDYAPFVSLPVASSLPAMAVPLIRGDNCTLPQ